VAGIIHAMTLLVVLLVASKAAALVPMAVLAAILMVVAYNMGEWLEIPELWRQGWTDRLVWLVTFVLTVVADLTVAVETGMILAALLFIRRVAVTTTVSRVTSDYLERAREHTLYGRNIPGNVAVFKVVGPFLFGATETLAAAIPPIDDLPAIVVLRLRYMPAIDATGLKAIQDLADTLKASGRTLLICGATSQPSRLMERAEFHRHIGEANILPNLAAALRRAEQLTASPAR
jgi:SulP family sulfate permease